MFFLHTLCKRPGILVSFSLVSPCLPLTSWPLLSLPEVMPTQPLFSWPLLSSPETMPTQPLAPWPLLSLPGVMPTQPLFSWPLLSLPEIMLPDYSFPPRSPGGMSCSAQNSSFSLKKITKLTKFPNMTFKTLRDKICRETPLNNDPLYPTSYLVFLDVLVFRFEMKKKARKACALSGVQTDTDMNDQEGEEPEELEDDPSEEEVFLCMRAPAFMCAHSRIYVCALLSLFVRMRTPVAVCAHACFNEYAHLLLCVCTHALTYEHVYLYVYAHLPFCVRTPVPMRAKLCLISYSPLLYNTNPTSGWNLGEISNRMMTKELSSSCFKIYLFNLSNLSNLLNLFNLFNLFNLNKSPMSVYMYQTKLYHFNILTIIKTHTGLLEVQFPV